MSPQAQQKRVIPAMDVILRPPVRLLQVGGMISIACFRSFVENRREYPRVFHLNSASLFPGAVWCSCRNRATPPYRICDRRLLHFPLPPHESSNTRDSCTLIFPDSANSAPTPEWTFTSQRGETVRPATCKQQRVSVIPVVLRLLYDLLVTRTGFPINCQDSLLCICVRKTVRL